MTNVAFRAAEVAHELAREAANKKDAEEREVAALVVRLADGEELAGPDRERALALFPRHGLDDGQKLAAIMETVLVVRRQREAVAAAEAALAECRPPERVTAELAECDRVLIEEARRLLAPKRKLLAEQAERRAREADVKREKDTAASWLNQYPILKKAEF